MAPEHHMKDLAPRHIGIEYFEQSFDVSAANRIHTAFESLDVLLRHHLLRKPGDFEGLGAMAEEPQLAHLSISDRPDIEEVGFGHSPALSLSDTLANWSQERFGLKLEAVVARDAFGFSWNNPLPSGEQALANEVTITAELQLAKQT